MEKGEGDMKRKLLLMFCAITLMSYVILLPRVQAQTPFITTDKFGNGKFTFSIDDDVYITGGFWYWEPNSEMTIYIIPSCEEIKPENKVTEPVTATTLPDESLPPTLIWNAPLKVGEYDVWVDTNQNGQYDPHVDAYRVFCCCHLFHVIPEYFIGSIGALIAMLASLAIFYKRKSTSCPKTS